MSWGQTKFSLLTCANLVVLCDRGMASILRCRVFSGTEARCVASPRGDQQAQESQVAQETQEERPQ